MKFEPRQIPEGINTSAQHPLKELFILVTGAGLILGVIVLVLVMLSDHLIRFIPPDVERQWFTESRLSFLKDVNPTETEVKVERYLASLVDNLTPHQSAPQSYTIRLIDSNGPNAFITPGGHIFVTRGLLRHVNSENALSMVIAHEMAHQMHRHPIRSMGRGVVVAVAMMMFTGVDGSEWVTQILSKSINLGLLSFSRQQEREADASGVRLLKQYYGHAEGASYFFSQLNRDSTLRQTGLTEYLSTHPNTDDRLAFLEQFESGDTEKLIPLPHSIQVLLDSGTE